MAHLFKRLVVVGLALAGIGAEPATAGTFHVYGLGLNGAGCPNGWQAQQIPADRFRQGNFCSRWEIQSVREGSLQRGDFAGTSMFAGAGARFTGFSIKSYGTARNGTTWKMAMCQTPFAGCTGLVPAVGLVGRDRVPARHPARAASPVYAQHLWAGVSCDDVDVPGLSECGSRRSDDARGVARRGRRLHAARRSLARRRLDRVELRPEAALVFGV